MNTKDNDARASCVLLAAESAQRNTHKQHSKRINGWQLHNLQKKRREKKVLDLVFGRSVYLEHSKNDLYDETIALIVAVDKDVNLFVFRATRKMHTFAIWNLDDDDDGFFPSFLISCTLLR